MQLSRKRGDNNFGRYEETSVAFLRTDGANLDHTVSTATFHGDSSAAKGRGGFGSTRVSTGDHTVGDASELRARSAKHVAPTAQLQVCVPASETVSFVTTRTRAQPTFAAMRQ